MAAKYLTFAYPDAFDFEALQGLLHGDMRVKAKAGFYIAGFVFSAYPGEPLAVSAVAPITPEQFLSNALQLGSDVAPFSEEEINTPALMTGVITDAVFLARLAATLRKYAPEILDFVKRIFLR